MKVARFFAAVFGIMGLVLMLGTAGLCFASLDAPVKADIPGEVRQCGEELVTALDAGDLTAASEKLYGQPDWGTDRGLTEETAAVWQIFCDGISCELTSDYYVVGSSYGVDAVITVPKIDTITDSVYDHARTMLDERIAVAEKMNELYDENNDFRQDLIDEIMAKAVELAFAEEPETLTYETSFGFVYQNEQWYAVPDGNLTRALAGGLE